MNLFIRIYVDMFNIERVNIFKFELFSLLFVYLIFVSLLSIYIYYCLGNINIVLGFSFNG